MTRYTMSTTSATVHTTVAHPVVVGTREAGAGFFAAHASLVPTTTGCATVVCTVAFVVLIVYFVKLMAHRSTYNY